VGITKMTNVIDQTWINKRALLSRITIREPNSGRALYFMDSKGKSSFYEGDDSEKFSSFMVGREELSVEIMSGKDTNTLLMEKAPWLILIFGITLTLIGTLYVRNNQRQSFKLASMNKALAQKNYELNSEISEREKLYQAMRKAERENRAIIDSVNDIIFETNTDGNLIFLNSTWNHVTGFEVDQAIGRNLFDMLHPQDQEEQRSSFIKLINGQKQAYRSFTRLRTNSGEFHSVELAMSMLRQGENKEMRVVGTITDVEERRRAERALSEAEKKYRTIVENAAGGIYQVTPEGHILSANPAMARILGYDSSEQLMREVKNIHKQVYAKPGERTQFIRELETVGSVVNFETLVNKQSGLQVWVNENARAVKDDDGNILYFEGSIEEITQRKEAEIKLREAKMHSDLANRAKSEFLANMSHELRTPLNAIIGFSEIIKDEILGPVGQKQYWEYARDIYDSGKNLLQIINEILDVSKIDAGERQLNESVIDMAGISQACVDMMSTKAESGQLSIINLMRDSDIRIVGEELAIKQVLLNLLSNAIKFTPAGGRITISHEMDSDKRLRVSITDTGVGLDDNEIEKALTPFGQIETAHSRSTSGAGLGLTLVDSLMKLHGGELELFSQKGIGTTATVIFPSKRIAKSREGEAGEVSSKETGGESIKEYQNIHPPSQEIQ
jgi:PAS domain S-box-containing protein